MVTYTGDGEKRRGGGVWFAWQNRDISLKWGSVAHARILLHCRTASDVEPRLVLART